MITNERKQEIVSIFQASFKRDNSAELNALPLSELRETDEMLGSRDLNEGFRLRLRNRIEHLEGLSSARRSTRDRIIDQGLGFVTGVIITLIGVAASHALEAGGP